MQMLPRHRTRPIVLALATALALGGLGSVVQPAAAASCPEEGTTVTCTFSNAAAAASFLVPPGVTSAVVTVRGGSGGVGFSKTSDSGGAGGAGGVTTATLALTPGTALGIYVGGNGGKGEGCTAADNGNPGSSGGIVTGGSGGHGLGPPGNPAVCAAGGGGGGSFVMLPGQSPSQIAFSGGTPTGVTPILAAGGGGGGGGGVAAHGNAGGAGGGKTSGAAQRGGGATGGQPGVAASAVGTDGAPAQSPGNPRDGGGGGGGGYPGGGGGAVTAEVADGNDPGSGGGGGGGFPAAGVSPDVVPAGYAMPVAYVVGPVTYGVAAAGSPGSVIITYAKGAETPAQTTDSNTCHPGQNPCVVQPAKGKETKFKVIATNGKRSTTLFATLNGGPAPVCRSVGGTLSPDWVQFGFTNGGAGKSWTKRVRATGTHGTTKRAARRVLSQTQICYAAPYRFIVKRGTELQRVGGHWEGVLAACDSKIIAAAAIERPNRARPCVLRRTLVKKIDGWVVRVAYRVPKGELDPQGRTLRKKKRHRH